jgi:alanine racemase
MQSPHVQTRVDLSRIRENVASIGRQVGVDIIAVVKCDAYGIGAMRVAETIADLVSGFCVFSLKEAIAADLRDVGHKPILSLGPSTEIDPKEFLAAGVRPSVWTPQDAERLRAARPVLCVDTGMQRFACPPAEVDAVLSAGEITEAFTHATRMEHVSQLKSAVAGRSLRLHAAASALLNEPAARLDAVRPGMAIYHGSARVSTQLLEVRRSDHPAGYTGFSAERFGIILCGYSHGLRPGLCILGGQRRRIVEVGMQSAFVEIGPNDQNGDEVVLLGDGLTESEIGGIWKCSEQQVLTALTSAGIRSYVSP